MLESYSCYGYRVECSAHPDASAVVRRFFGAPVAAASPAVRVRVDVVAADGGEPTTPPYFPPDWEHADPVVIDLGRSTAAISPAAGTVDVSLAEADLGNPIVWGRWLLEKAFLLLTLRSPEHYGLHSGAIVVDGHTVVVTADSGVGKSTFAAWGLRRGAGFLGEDALVRHLGDDTGRFFGYPRAAYLGPELVSGWAELAGGAAVPGRDKMRVEWPAAFAGRLVESGVPVALLVLTRAHQEVRPLTVDETVALCRSDFAAGKPAGPVLDRVEADVRARFSTMRLAEFGLGSDLDLNYERLRALLAAG